ncbi:uncharacterized protein RJT20DRAFT_29186 [Scheffersomyces xylosifermentans]|uniref:uncharacterized protein n=1 Tax=Scheffersomyces xylosifermentans TaxID=1304137 RepID=UPI00315D348C
MSPSSIPLSDVEQDKNEDNNSVGSLPESTFTSHKNNSTSTVNSKRPSVSFHPSTFDGSNSSHPILNRSRSVSSSHFPTINGPLPTNYVPQSTRNHSSSINSVSSLDSVASANLNNLIKQDASPYQTAQYNKYGKIKLMEDIDVEKQLIISAGGKKEYVFCFVLKLLLLAFIVLGSGILIFYAL